MISAARDQPVSESAWTRHGPSSDYGLSVLARGLLPRCQQSPCVGGTRSSQPLSQPLSALSWPPGAEAPHDTPASTLAAAPSSTGAPLCALPPSVAPPTPTNCPTSTPTSRALSKATYRTSGSGTTAANDAPSVALACQRVTGLTRLASHRSVLPLERPRPLGPPARPKACPHLTKSKAAGCGLCVTSLRRLAFFGVKHLSGQSQPLCTTTTWRRGPSCWCCRSAAVCARGTSSGWPPPPPSCSRVHPRSFAAVDGRRKTQSLGRQPPAIPSRPEAYEGGPAAWACYQSCSWRLRPEGLQCPTADRALRGKRRHHCSPPGFAPSPTNTHFRPGLPPTGRWAPWRLRSQGLTKLSCRHGTRPFWATSATPPWGGAARHGPQHRGAPDEAGEPAGARTGLPCSCACSCRSWSGCRPKAKRRGPAHRHRWSPPPTHRKMLDANCARGRPPHALANPAGRGGQVWGRDCHPHRAGLDLAEPVRTRQGASQTGFCKCLQPHFSDSSLGDGRLPLPQHKSLGDLVLPASILPPLRNFPHPVSGWCSARRPSWAVAICNSNPCFDPRPEIWALGPRHVLPGWRGHSGEHRGSGRSHHPHPHARGGARAGSEPQQVWSGWSGARAGFRVGSAPSPWFALPPWRAAALTTELRALGCRNRRRHFCHCSYRSPGPSCQPFAGATVQPSRCAGWHPFAANVRELWPGDAQHAVHAAGKPSGATTTVRFDGSSGVLQHHRPAFDLCPTWTSQPGALPRWARPPQRYIGQPGCLPRFQRNHSPCLWTTGPVLHCCCCGLGACSHTSDDFFQRACAAPPCPWSCPQHEAEESDALGGWGVVADATGSFSYNRASPAPIGSRAWSPSIPCCQTRRADANGHSPFCGRAPPPTRHPGGNWGQVVPSV